ncbi:MAG: hypothetical protein U1F76_28445 [Candidatus Competibacteraceae bacterium]
MGNNTPLVNWHNQGIVQRNYLYSLIDEFIKETGSPWGKTLLADFRYCASKFWLVKPKAAELATLLNTLRKTA